jgi:signal transduction histidine kinase
MACVKIRDTGEGIPADKIPHIWNRYYKVDKEHRRAMRGSGLGLSIVRNILELHHAQYGVTSEVGTGSTFWFSLPEEQTNTQHGKHTSDKISE